MDNHQLLVRPRQLTRRLWAGTIVIATLCSHCATLLMSIQPTPPPKAQWNNEEILALINHLDANKSQGEGAGNFKEVTYNSAATAIASFHTSGPQKTAKHCRTKWGNVRLIFLLLSHTIIFFFRLKPLIRLLRPIRTSREPTGITPTVQMFKALPPLLFLMRMHH
jgi:hypothetical protein